MIKLRNQMLVEFGQGDIVVSALVCGDGVGVLTLKDAEEPMEIGTAVPRNEEADPFDVPIILSFTDIRSLDVVIDHLNSIRVHMKDWEDGKFDDTYAGDETSD